MTGHWLAFITVYSKQTSLLSCITCVSTVPEALRCPQAVCMERQAFQRAKEAYLSGRTRPVEFRLQQLHALQRMITEKETEISTALKQDINRVSGDIRYMLRAAVCCVHEIC